MKWTMEKLSPAVEYARLDEKSGVWYVPFLQFFAAGEETNQFLALAFPASDEDRKDAPYSPYIEIEGVEIRYIWLPLFAPGEVHHHKLRPFVKRVVRRNLGLYAEAVASAIWYLDHWKEPVCQAWDRIRGNAYGWKFQDWS